MQPNAVVLQATLHLWMSNNQTCIDSGCSNIKRELSAPSKPSERDRERGGGSTMNQNVIVKSITSHSVFIYILKIIHHKIVMVLNQT